jgi:tRNA(Ile)-lysidine synthase
LADARGSLKDKVAGTIRRWDLAEPNSSILVAFSGGADSTALALLLHELGYEVVLGHVNHGLRPDSDEDVSHCRWFAGRLGVPIRVERVDVDPPTEARARKLRYAALEKMAGDAKASRIATGHTMDDQAETVLFRLGRGGFPIGIRLKRGKIIRPLLDLRRADTERVCRDHGVEFLIDPTNVEERYARNRIRLRVMPIIQEWVPAFANLSVLGERRAELVRSHLDRAELAGYLRPSADDPAVDRDWLLKQPVPVRRQALRRLLASTGAEPSSRLVADVDEKIAHHGARLDLPNGWEAVATAGEVRLQLAGADDSQALPEVVVQIPGRTVAPDWRLEIDTEIVEASSIDAKAQRNRHEIALDADKVGVSIHFRQRREGDRFQPQGMAGTKKLQDFFVDLKLPRKERDRIPIFVSGSMIASVGNLRADERFAVTDVSKRILRIRLFPFLSGG